MAAVRVKQGHRIQTWQMEMESLAEGKICWHLKAESVTLRWVTLLQMLTSWNVL